MKLNLLKTTASIAILASIAFTASATLAGGIDRSGQSIGVIFEKGNYLELAFGIVSPEITGVATPVMGGGASGDMAKTFTQLGLAYKHSFGNGLDAAIIFDQPFGADVLYPAAPYFNTGAAATLNSNAITGVVKYTFPENFSVFGGLRYQTLEAEAAIPIVGGYTVSAPTNAGIGYLVGAAYEIPEMALRVALTYNSKVKHALDTTEFGGMTSVTNVETPQSVNLEFQSGIAANTLLFGSIRWVDWSSFDITPAQYLVATGASLVSYNNDSITYNLGVGYRIDENWSGAVSVGYEKSNGGFASNLGPTDGNYSIGVGATYTAGSFKTTLGVRYVKFGDAQTSIGGVAGANFTDNSAIAVGMKFGYSF